MKRYTCKLAISLLTCVLAVPIASAEIFRNDFGMKFILIPAGEFMRGTTVDDLDKVLFEMEVPDLVQIQDESPRHAVRISKDYWLAQTEITQAQWSRVMKTKPGPVENWQRPDWETLPVVSISWNMAQQFIATLSKIDERHTYRLPTEAEWEYAARAGSNALRPMSPEQLDDYAWMLKNSGDVPHPVATKKPNAYGLYDMLGNAWEWVNDRYSSYGDKLQIDPAGPGKGLPRIRRGGSFHCPLYQMRPAFRSLDANPDTKYTVTGFRVIMMMKNDLMMDSYESIKSKKSKDKI